MSQHRPAQPNGRPEFVTLIAVYQFINAGILLLLSCLIPAVVFPSMFVYVGAAEGIFTGILLATVIMTLLLGFAFASLVIGWGLLRLREWARLGAIVLAAFALIGFPIWTIVAILILIYLTSEEGRAAFRPAEASRSARTESPEQAVYKAEPPTSPAEETRRITYTGQTTTPPAKTNGSPEDTVSSDETGAVPMPPEDPAWATETFYDQEADVSDHFLRWKATIPQEKQPTAEVEVESVEDSAEDTTEQGASDEDPEAASDKPLSAEEGDLEQRVWGPEETTPGAAREEQASESTDDDKAEENDETERG